MSSVSRQPMLCDVRTRLVSLATDDGRYAIVCGRTGARPVPVSGLRFADRETAARAVRIAKAYRTRLRRYDPRLPVHEFVVHETTPIPSRNRAETPVTVGSHGPLPTEREPTGVREGSE